MNRRLTMSAGVAAALCAGAAFIAARAGDLNPPAGPVAPSMRTMSEVYDAVAGPGSEPFRCAATPSGVVPDLPIQVSVAGLPGASGVEVFNAFAFNHSITRRSSASGATHGDIVIVKQLDRSTPKMYQACANGTHLMNVVLTFRQVANAQTYFQITLNNVIVSSSRPTFTPACEGNSLPMEEVSLSYTSMTIGTAGAPGSYSVTITNPSPPVN